MARTLRPHDCTRMIGIKPAMSLEILLFDIVNVHNWTVAPPPAEHLDATRSARQRRPSVCRFFADVGRDCGATILPRLRDPNAAHARIAQRRAAAL